MVGFFHCHVSFRVRVVFGLLKLLFNDQATTSHPMNGMQNRLRPGTIKHARKRTEKTKKHGIWMSHWKLGSMDRI